jgi:chaperonin cofactor prefoldin
VQEASRFVGQAPVRSDPNEVKDLKQKRDELQAEVDRLTRENSSQEEKIRELQRTVEIMQARSAK